MIGTKIGDIVVKEIAKVHILTIVKENCSPALQTLQKELPTNMKCQKIYSTWPHLLKNLTFSAMWSWSYVAHILILRHPKCVRKLNLLIWPFVRRPRYNAIFGDPRLFQKRQWLRKSIFLSYFIVSLKKIIYFICTLPRGGMYWVMDLQGARYFPMSGGMYIVQSDASWLAAVYVLRPSSHH